jgi:hypothetical protein
MRSSSSERVQGGAGEVLGDDPGQSPGTPPARARRESRQIEAKVGGFVEGSFEVAAGQDVRQVDHGAGGSRDRNPVLFRYIVRSERRAVRDHEPVPATAAWCGHGYVDARSARLP